MNYIETIHISPPYKNIYARLGFNIHKTILSPQKKCEIDIQIEEASAMCCLRGFYEIITLLENNNSGIITANKIKIESVDLVKFLQNNRSMIFMGVSAGSNISQKIEELFKTNTNSKALVFDATASEMTDSALSFLHKHISLQERRFGITISEQRYSPGYGDLNLSVQKIIYESLRLKDYGIQLTNTFQLIPEKSVLAIAGAG